jgi:acyl carrier protein
MFPKNGVATRMNEVFRDVFDDSAIEICDDMTAADVENWDSLTHINLIVALEKAFGIRFTTGEAGASLKNVGELRTLIEGKLGAKR